MDGLSTLVGAARATLGSGLFLRMVVSPSNMFAYFIFCSAMRASIPFITLTNSSTVRMVRSSSDRDGSLQWVGKGLDVPAMRVAQIWVMK